MQASDKWLLLADPEAGTLVSKGVDPLFVFAFIHLRALQPSRLAKEQNVHYIVEHREPICCGHNSPSMSVHRDAVHAHVLWHHHALPMLCAATDLRCQGPHISW